MGGKKSLIYGVGVNDADYVVLTTLNGRQIKCKFYQTWYNMLRRCYSTEYHTSKPTYVGCSVCQDWLYFMNFKRWMELQDWKGNHLDKDILLSGNKIYSPDTCAFVPLAVNAFVLSGLKSCVGLPIGVTYSRGRYRACGYVKSKGRRSHIGVFDTREFAHLAYLNSKIEHISVICKDVKDKRVVLALLKRYQIIQPEVL